MRKFPDFIDVQPPKAFVEELKRPMHSVPPAHFRAACEPLEGEIGICGAFLDKCYPDPEGLLDTVCEDFEAFARVCGFWGDRVPIRLGLDAAYTGEAHKIEVNENGVTVLAGSTEGIRRALYFLEDCIIKRGGPILPRGDRERRLTARRPSR